MRNRKGIRGVTLIETALVIGIIGLLAALSTPGLLRNMSHYRLNTASRCLVSDLRLARHMALKENRPVRLNFIDQRRYRLEKFVNNNWTAAGNEVNFTSDHGRRGIIFSQIPAPVEFDYLGKANPPGAIQLLSEKGESRTVEVSASGRINEY